MAKNKRHKKEKKQKIDEHKKELECITCGENRPQCLDFHHEDEKTETIANVHNRGWSWKKILEEIQKCTVLCANCHRILHWEERGRENHGRKNN